jgi:hypothetical protein
MFLNVGLAALIAHFFVKHLTMLPAKPIAFAVAIGLYIGRGHGAEALGDFGAAGYGAGGLVALAVLWFFWFKKSSSETVDG